ncbi:MAG: TPR end-of-group domain-containing protein, partial [Thermoanaerobaculia bacterium]
PWFEVALAYAQLGELDRAFECLEQAYLTRSAWMPYLKVETRLDPLRADPRFKALLDRMAFPR